MSTGIEWTNETWNPVSGCTRVSAGCDNCYAVVQTFRCGNMGQGKYAGLTVRDKRGKRQFNGIVRCHEDELQKPLRWRKGRMIFVNSMSDLFHRDVPLAFIRKVFETIRECPQHVFQVLTKRPERVVELDADLDWPDNLWMGVSVENQDAVQSIMTLGRCRAKVKWLSIEPLIGQIDCPSLGDVDWVIVGGESGRHARPCSFDWIRDIAVTCMMQGVPFFFKQWGKLRNNPDLSDPTATENGGTTKGGKLLQGQVRQETPSQTDLARRRQRRADRVASTRRYMEYHRRYLLAKETAFSNAANAVDSGLGHKVKRQDGKEPTDGQIGEINAVVTDFDNAVGDDLQDLRCKTGLTVCHTSGKRPLLSTSSGLYCPSERTVVIGTVVDGRNQLLGAHELAHWLDAEAGRVSALRNGHANFDLSMMLPCNDHESAIFKKAVREMNHPRQLGQYWRRRSELFARLVEQYVSIKHGVASAAAGSEKEYLTRKGYWGVGNMNLMFDNIGAMIRRRIGIIRRS